MVRRALVLMIPILVALSAALLLAEPPGAGTAPPAGAPPPAAEARGAKPDTAPLRLTRRPLAEIVREVSARIGRPIAFRSESTGRHEAAMTLPAPDPDTLMEHFGRALERENIALLREEDPSHGWTLVAFTRPAAAPVPALRPTDPFTVRVVAGRVELQLGDGRASRIVEAGEEGAVTVAGLLAPPRRIDPVAVALWRPDAAPAVAAAAPEGTSDLALEYRVRVLGTTDDGQTVVEWNVPDQAPRRAIVPKDAFFFTRPPGE